MKKILFLFTLLLTNIVYAQNEIYNIDIAVDIDENANAQITEKWHVKGEDGTEWYKPLRYLSNSKLSNFEVYMDNQKLIQKEWNIHESLNEKKGFYGINYTDKDIELCFGKSDYKEHTFILKYQLSNYIFNTDDAQVLYWTYIPILQNVNFRNMSINIKSYYSFPDNLDVWGYGYKGYAYVKDGMIKLSNEENTSMNNQYVVLLAKFPLNTFNTTNQVNKYSTFKDVLDMANQDTFQYEYNDEEDIDDKNILIGLLGTAGIFSGTIFLVYKAIQNSGYGYKDNKKIDKKATPYFRDIPCNKDIYYANALVYLNNFNNKETNILGAIILKWIKEKKINLLKEPNNSLDLRNNPTFDNQEEKKLFDIMYQASNDGILEANEFKKWAKIHYSKFFEIFREFKDKEINKLKDEGHIYKRNDRDECKYVNVLDDIIYEDSTRLLGLKKFLEDFSNIHTKETLEVHLWDEYLMFAYLFGIANKVAKQFKNLYPELMEQQDIDYHTIMMINHITIPTVNAATSTRSAAQSYSSGGGGFSSGGGGGGSFGGGGFSGGGSR